MKFLIACIAALGSLTALLAANCNYSCYSPQRDLFGSCSNFQGLYVGGNIGVFNHVAHLNDLDGFFTNHAGWSAIDTSCAAGMQFGYDWLCNNQLIGIVGDWNWVGSHLKIDDDPDNTAGENFHKHNTRWLATIRGRFGITIHDALIYLTAGAAALRHDNRLQRMVVGIGETTGRFRDRRTRWGYIGGTGVEFKLGNRWSVGVEALLFYIPNYSRTFTAGNEDDFNFQFSDSGYVGRFLLNYRFGDLFWCW